MTVYDVVQHIAPDAPTSKPTGRWYVTVSEDEPWARVQADLLQSRTYVRGITFAIEAHDVHCRGRAKHWRETHETGPCTCNP